MCIRDRAIAINRQLADHGGDLAIGAFGIINRILILFAMLVIGLTQGMQPIIGYKDVYKRQASSFRASCLGSWGAFSGIQTATLPPWTMN